MKYSSGFEHLLVLFEAGLDFAWYRISPKCWAKHKDASLPLGSIIPCMRSNAERTSPSLMRAVVPLIDAYYFVIVIKLDVMSMLNRFASCYITYKVIILVHEANSRLSYGFHPASSS